MLIMTTTVNAENLRQYKRRFPLIKEQILAFRSRTNWLEKLRICLQIQKNCITMSYVIDNYHSEG